MCVIMTADTERPTKKEMRQAAAANPHGAGLAWLENGAVKFEKVGDDPKEIERIIGLALTVPLPMVVHFRITSSGVTSETLSHPFPIRVKHATATRGKAGAVLFHNGTWHDWQQPTLAAAASTGTPMGDEPWSDSRAMAFLAAVLGRGALQTIPDTQRVAVLTADGITRQGKGWSQYAKGLWVSNTHWVPKPATREDAGFALAAKPTVKTPTNGRSANASGSNTFIGNDGTVYTKSEFNSWIKSLNGGR